MKRGKISFSGGDVFRISRPGFDVDTAPEHGFHLHESHLYTQPFWWKMVPCPFASVPPGTAQTASVTETFPDTGALPLVTFYPVASTGAILFPHPASFGVVSPNHWPLESWAIEYEHTQTSITVSFRRNAATQYTPQGVRVLLMRSPIA